MDALAARTIPLESGWGWSRTRDTGTQWLPVSGLITNRLLVTFRAKAARLRALVPSAMELDTLEGYGLISVCVLEVVDMGVDGTPSWLRFDNREFLYRLGVRLYGEPTFITLRSDVSSRAMAALGRRFSHYRPHLANVTLEREPKRLRFAAKSRDGHANARVEASLEPTCAPADSLFGSAQGAAEFLLGMPFSADQAPSGRVRVQYIEHDPWNAELVTAERHEFEPLRRLEQQLGARFEYDHTLAVKGIRQQWKAARWL